MKTRLYDFIKDCVTLEEMITIIEEYEIWRCGEAEENVFDLNKPSDYSLFVEMYGNQTTERCKGITRCWLGGNAYYSNVEDKTMTRNNQIKPLTECEMLMFIRGISDEMEDMFNEFLSDHSVEETKDAIYVVTSNFKGTIDFEGYAKMKYPARFPVKFYEFEAEAVVNFKKVVSLGRTEEEAWELAKEQIKAELSRPGSFEKKIEDYNIRLWK